ncbi:hypothetical protein ACFOYW_18320 [Gryllotalpicola reticulitermitis]|uniref:DUF4175 domain-containing protein n=1 Tax=Gryllotalpicola reticulitermitis TaxID=1184153 RepID=A0ABV8QBS9_9MICO
MNNGSGGGLFQRFFEACLLVCGAVILLYVALSYLARIWWILVILAAVGVGIGVLVTWWRARNSRW